MLSNARVLQEAEVYLSNHTEESLYAVASLVQPVAISAPMLVYLALSHAFAQPQVRFLSLSLSLLI